MSRQAVYGYVCAGCKHAGSVHLLLPRSQGIVLGPYECPCGCQIRQDSPMRAVTKAEWDALGYDPMRADLVIS